jgi:hypothetical protein
VKANSALGYRPVKRIAKNTTTLTTTNAIQRKKSGPSLGGNT